MRSLHITVVALGTTMGTLSLSGLMQIGCGDDVSATPIDSGADTTADHELHSGPEAQAEAAHNSPTDSGADVAWDSPPVGLVVATNEATAYCVASLNCCRGGLDSGTYDLQRCIDSSTTLGWEGTLPKDTRVYSRGHITVDQSKAASCISALRSFPCGMQTAAQWGAITSACEFVIQGTIPADTSGCISSFECTPGNYCDPTLDGGLCTPLAKQGQPCNTKINDPTLGLNPLADQMCSYLSSGQPPLFCDLINDGPDAATCQPLVASGGRCSNAMNTYYDDQACTPPALCGDNLQCGGTTTYPYANFCQFYRLQDAGGPG